MTEKKLQKYICANCGYVYDPANGDPMNHVPPGTAFEHLPEGWVCPVCYVTTDQFDPLD
jgi:rubredoxin